MATPQSLTYSVEAYNLSHSSENKIHDNTVARKLGFTRGLVPGVEVFGYASHVPLEHWGRTFLERGRMAGRFAKPVYDGRTAIVTGDKNGSQIDLKVESEGVLCATGAATLPEHPPEPPPLSNFPPAIPPANRPAADDTSLDEGRYLASAEVQFDEQSSTGYLRDVRETSTIYRDEGLAHPGYLLRLCNRVLVDNVVLAPWIHTGSDLQFHGLARIGDRLVARAHIAANYERKGHRFVDLDCLILANGERPIAHVQHTAIYRLRHLAT
jgi:acyl dehydratase